MPCPLRDASTWPGGVGDGKRGTCRGRTLSLAVGRAPDGIVIYQHKIERELVPEGICRYTDLLETVEGRGYELRVLWQKTVVQAVVAEFGNRYA